MPHKGLNTSSLEEIGHVLRLTKESDYGIVLLIRMAEDGTGVSHSARGLAEEVHLPVPMVSKILKALAREGLLESTRGAHGGYRLVVDPANTSVADIVTAIEGPIAVTQCQQSSGESCSIEWTCSARRKWNRINTAVHRALDAISLAEMAKPLDFQEIAAEMGSETGAGKPAEKTAD